MAIALQSLYVAVGAVYLVRLPRILHRRMEWEQSVNLDLAKQNRRQYMWGTMGRSVGAAIGGIVIMGTIVMAKL